jgi:hypothetical protein
VPFEINYDALALKKFDEAELARIFTELGFNRLLTQLGLPASQSEAADSSAVVSDLGEPASVKTISHDYQ